MERAPNLILLTIDALRADHVSTHGYHRETTPRLDAFAQRNLQFSTAIAPSSHTREALPPLLSGQYPEAVVANGFQQVDDPLPARLKRRGYHTGGFHSNPYLSRAYGYDAGFEKFYDDLYLARHKVVALAQQAIDKYLLRKGEYYARAPELNRRALDWVDSLDGPFFLWNHYMDVHGPYHAPEQHFADRSLSAGAAEDLYRKAWKQPDEITDEQRQLLVDSYDDEIRCFDAALGRFLDGLAERDLFEESLVVVTADHGDGFGEHGYYGHPRRLDDSLLHVPLVVSPPGNGRDDDTADEVTAPVSTLNIAATLAAAAGLTTGGPGEALVERSATVDGEKSATADDKDSTGGEWSAADVDTPRVFASVAPENDNGHRRFAVRTPTHLLRQERAVETNELRSETVDDVGNGDGLALDQLREELTAFARERLHDLGSTDLDSEPETTDEIEARLEALGYK